MMDQIFTVSVCQRELAVYWPQGQAVSHSLGAPSHKHGYGELHCLLAGQACFTIEENKYELHPGDALYIPPGLFHSSTTLHSPLDVAVLSVELDEKQLLLGQFDTARLRQTLQAMERPDAEAIHALLFFLTDLLFKQHKLQKAVLWERQIDRYISLHYSEPLTLADLAGEMHLSPVQTARVFRRATGKTFLTYLTDYRMEVAAHLKATTTLTAEQIAQQVGYSSYPGFWKAWRRYLAKNKEEGKM